MSLKPLLKITFKTPQASTEHLLTKDMTTVGRSVDNDVAIESVGISRKHLKIEQLDERVTITDLGSTNGTYYNGIRLKPNTPVVYEGGVFYLGPKSDGNAVEIKKETAVREGTQSFVAPIDHHHFKKVQEEESEFDDESDGNSEMHEGYLHPKSESGALVAEDDELADTSSDESAPVSSRHDDIKAAIAATPAPENKVPDDIAPFPAGSVHGPRPAAVSAPVYGKSSDLSITRQLEIKEELRKMRYEHEQAEKARVAAESKRRVTEEEILRLKNEIEVFDVRLSALRSRAEEEEAKAKSHLQELEQKLAHEQKKYKTRRDELSREQDALYKAEQETAAKQEELHKLKERVMSEIESSMDRAEREKEKLAAVHRSERQRLEEEHDILTKRLDEEASAQKKKLASEQSEELSRYHERMAAEKKRSEERQEAELKRMTSELDAVRERTSQERDRLTDDLEAHTQATIQEREELDSAHKEYVAKLKESESKVKAEFDAVEKKYRVQLETLVAEIELREAQEKKYIEQRKTEKVVAERELTDAKADLEAGKKELATIRMSIGAAQEQLSQREAAQEKFQDAITKLEDREKRLKTENQKLADTAAQKQDALTKLEAELAEQQHKNKLNYEKALQEAESERKAIIASGIHESERSRAEAMETLERQLTTRREEAKSKLAADVTDWEHALSQRKSREQEEFNLWKAQEKKSIQDRLSGDLDAFVNAVTSSALSQIQQNPQFSSLVHEFHGKFSNELRHALTTTQGEFVAQFNPNRKEDTKKFWVKSAVAAVAIIFVGLIARVAPDYIRDAAEQRRSSKDDGATGEWIKKIQVEREQRLALKLETRADFQNSYTQNVLYNEGYLEMKLDTKLQSEWVKALNNLLTGEKAMGMDDEALVDYIRVEHSLFIDLAEMKSKMNAINKDDLILQMEGLSKQAHIDLLAVLRNKTLPSSDRARQTSPDHKWKTIRELEEKFYADHVTMSERRPATKK